MPLIEWVVSRPGLKLGIGDSINYTGDADLVFSHLYGPLPEQLIGKPAIVNVCGGGKAQAEKWCCAELTELGWWAKGNVIYLANMEWRCCRPTIDDLTPDEYAPGRGWFPDELCKRLLRPFRDLVIFDGFMGRGTVGKAARALGMSFVGIDRNPERVALAQEYIGC